MKKIISLMLAVVMLFCMVTVSIAAPDVSTLESTKIVNVVGKLENGGERIKMLLSDGDDVKYINEFTVEESGEYRFKFKCADIAGLTLRVKQGDEDVTSSVVEAVAENDAVVYSLDVVNSPINTEVIAEIENHYNVEGKEYQVIVAYYGENNTLQNVIVNDKKVGKGLNIFAEDFKIPDDAEKIKVFMWDNAKTMIPLAESVEGKKNDTIRVLAIGNSYAVDAYTYLGQIAESEGYNMVLRIAQQSGATFTKHWKTWTAETEEGRKKYTENGEKVDIEHFLEDGTRYDYITIQQSNADSGDRETFLENAENVVKYLREKQPTAEILIHQTWSCEHNSPVEAFEEKYKDSQEFMTQEIKWCVENARVVLGKVVTDSGLEVSPGGKPLRYIPSGDSVTIARENPMFQTTHNGNYEYTTYKQPENMEQTHPERPSLQRDSYHLSNKYGRYMVGLVWFSCLTGESVANNTFVNPQEKYQINDEERAILTNAAERAVIESGIWR